MTQGPGLVGSLLVGVSFAKAAAAATGLPLVAVHHLAGHVESLVLQNGELPYPAVVLVVSGGHTSLYLVDEPGHYQRLSRTRDDAAGEAYDKVAKLLGLGYPGGPAIDRLARTGNDRAIALPTTRLTHPDRNAPELKGDLDFSFSGLKTAVLRHVRTQQQLRQGTAPLFTEYEIADICASFQRVVVCVLVESPPSMRRAGISKEHRRRRRRVCEQPPPERIRGARPCARHADILPLGRCRPTCAMIAAAGLRKLRAGVTCVVRCLNADGSAGALNRVTGQSGICQ